MPPTNQGKCGDAGGAHVDDVSWCKCVVSCGFKNDCSDDDSNGLTEAGGILQNLSANISVKLTVLNLSGQGLEFFPENEDLAGVNVLNLSKNAISELPSSLSSARFLRVLNVSHNRLTEFPKVLTDGLYILKELNLSHNPINTLPRPQCYQHLTVLRARNCNISGFPLWLLYELHFVEILDLSSNDIFYRIVLVKNKPFHQSCNNLKRVNFSNTSFSDPHVPIISQFSQLEYLDVSNYTRRYTNSFAGFEDNLPQGLKVLKAVDCRMVQKVNLMSTRTEKANLSCNALVVLNEVNISTHMRYLVLSDCFLVNLPENFGDMVALVYLNLSRNDLCCLPASFGCLKELVHLDLYQNSFLEFPSEELRPLKKITCFDMCMNNFEVPSYPLGEGAPSYERLRAKLRSAISSCRNSGKITYSGPEYSEEESGSGPDRSWSFEEYYEDGSSSSPSKTEFVRRNDDEEEEDWDAVDPDLIYRDPQPRNDWYAKVDPFSGEYKEDLVQWILRLVPKRIRDSPFFFYREAQPSVVSNPSCDREKLHETIAVGQFDDA